MADFLISEPGNPQWANRLIERTKRAFNTVTAPTSPVGIPAYQNPSALPPAGTFTPAKGQSGLVMVISIPALAYSDGVHWLRADTGAQIA